MTSSTTTAISQYVVYALVDPRTNCVRYLGKTSNPKRRLKEHMLARDDSHRSRWIRELKSLGLKPRLIVMMSGLSETQAFEAEKAAIAGCDNLTNMTVGGEGSAGHERPQSAREAQAAKMREYWANPDNRKAQSARFSGRKVSKKTKKKMSQAMKGNQNGLGKHPGYRRSPRSVG